MFYQRAISTHSWQINDLFVNCIPHLSSMQFCVHGSLLPKIPHAGITGKFNPSIYPLWTCRHPVLWQTDCLLDLLLLLQEHFSCVLPWLVPLLHLRITRSQPSKDLSWPIPKNVSNCCFFIHLPLPISFCMICLYLATYHMVINYLFCVILLTPFVY